MTVLQTSTADYRNGIDVMTTETTCLSSVWRTDDSVKEWYEVHGRPADYKEQNPGEITYYDGMIYVDLINNQAYDCNAFPPEQYLYTSRSLNANLDDILDEVEKTGC